MVFSKLKDQITHWLSSQEQTLNLYENNDEILLQRHVDAVLIRAQLTSQENGYVLTPAWMRLGGTSLEYFQGALCKAPGSGVLWLVLCLKGRPSEMQLLKGLENLLNQRDTWRSTAVRFAQSPQNLKPTSLRSLYY